MEVNIFKQKTVFIAWSGKPSRRIARLLRDLFSACLCSNTVWMSETEIKPGNEWPQELRKRLKSAVVIIPCITRSNIKSPWLHWEAAASDTTVIPVRCDISESDLRQPLSDYQSVEFEKNDIRKVLRRILELVEVDQGQEAAAVDRFDELWGYFQGTQRKNNLNRVGVLGGILVMILIIGAITVGYFGLRTHRIPIVATYPGFHHPAVDYLSRLKIDKWVPVRVRDYSDLTNFIEMDAPVDILTLTSGSYARLLKSLPQQIDDYACFLPSDETREYGPKYRSVFVWKEEVCKPYVDKRASKPSDLPISSEQDKFLFVDQDSSSGFLMPLRALGLGRKSELSTLKCSGSHENSLRKLLDAQECVIIATNHDEIRKHRWFPLKNGEYKWIDVEPAIPRSPYCARKHWTRSERKYLHNLFGMSFERVESTVFERYYDDYLSEVLFEGAVPLKCELSVDPAASATETQRLTRFRVIYFDMDGTLLDSKNEIREANVMAIQSFQKCGGKIGIATGRSAAQVRPYLQVIKPDLPLIVQNGAVTLSNDSSHVLQVNALESSTVSRILQVADQKDVEIMATLLYTATKVITANEFKAVREFFQEKRIQVTSIVEDLDTYLKSTREDTTKILMVVSPDQALSFAESISQSLSNHAHVLVTDLEHGVVEVVKSGVNKSVAATRVLRQRGILSDRVVVFGDSGNDYELVRDFAVSIAMKDCAAETCDAALFVTGSNDSDSIKEVIERLVLLEQCTQ